MDQNLIREQFAVMNNAYRRYPFSYFLDSMERLGLYQIDLWGGSPHFYAPEMTEKKLGRFRNEVRDRGMQIIAYTPEIISYPYDLAAENAALRRRSIEYFKLNLEIADTLECPLMLIGPGFCELDHERDAAFLRFEESLEELLEYGKSSRVLLAVEHLTVNSSNLINRPQDLERLITDVDAKQSIENHVGCVLDLGQMSVFGDSVSDYFETLKERIWHVHMMDGAPEGHLAFGDGCFPLEQYYIQVREGGYAGPITLEINDRRYTTDPHMALTRCVKAMENWKGAEL